MKTISIPDVGEVDFPDEMSDEDISRAIQTQIIPQHAPHLQIPEPRQPTPEEMSRPGLMDGYQQPVNNLLKSPPPAHPGMGDFPDLKSSAAYEQSRARKPDVNTYEPPDDLRSYLDEAARPQGIVAEKVIGSVPIRNRTNPEEIPMPVSAFGKGVTGAVTAMAQNPRAAPGEEGFIGQTARMAGDIAGQAAVQIPPFLLGPEIGMPAAGGYQMIRAANAQKETSQFGNVTDVEAAGAQGGLGAAGAGFPAAVGKNLLVKILSGSVFGGAQGVASATVQQMADTGEIDLTDPATWEAGLTAAGMGAVFGAFHQPIPGRSPKPEMRPGHISKEMIEAGAYGHQEGSFYPPEQGPARPEPQPPQPTPIPQRERGLFEAAPVPEDMAGRQFAAGTEAQTALREAQAARDPLAKAHEEALRASVEAENELRGRFPDEGVSPKYPAERDLLRALNAKHQEAETLAAEARARLDGANTVLEEAQRKASQAQQTPLPEGPIDRLQGRRDALRAMQEAGLPPEHIQRAIEVMDKRPEIYELGSKAVDLSPEVLAELGVGKDVSRETPLLQTPSELSQRASGSFRRMVDEMNGKPPSSDPETHISAELDFGEGSPYSKKYPNFSKMPFGDKMQVTKHVMGDAIQRAARHAGISIPAESYGAGKWGKWDAQPSTSIRVHGSPEQVDKFANALGYLTQQTGIFSFRKSEAGQGVGYRILEDGGFFKDPQNAQKFWAELEKELPNLPGFSHHEHAGAAGIFMGLPDATPADRAALDAQILPAVERALDKFGLSGRSKFLNVEIKQYGHDWKADENGTSYARGLGGEGRPGVPGPSLLSDARQVEARIQQSLRSRGALLQERDPAHGGSERDGSGLAQRFGIEPEALAANTPEAAKSVYKALGNDLAEGNTSADLKIYPLHDIAPEKMQAWLDKSGWNYKIFGPDQETGKFVPPNFKEFSYDNKHVWIFSPWTEHGSFRDTEYTRTWRVTHEIAHGQTNASLTEKYGGVGRRQGALGRATKFNGRDVPPLELAEALRAVEWEHETFRRQREILERDFGITITDEQFRKENAVNMADATYRVLTGDFSNPGELGLKPKALPPDQLLAKTKEILRTAAKDAGIDMAETFGSKAFLQDGGQKKEYIYKSPNRPVKSITLELPKGYRSIDDNTFAVDKPLAFSLEKNLQLEPQDEAHPTNIKKRFDAAEKEIDQLSDYNMKGFQIGERTLYTPDMINGGDKWRVTHFDENGKPSGHMNFRDYLEARADAAHELMRFKRESKGKPLAQGNGDIRGAFLPSTAEKKGMVYLVKGKADLSTVLHEYLGHGMEEKVLRAPENKALLAEAETLITKDIGAEAVKDGWTREAKEWLADKVEQYFYEGNTDVPTLKPLFEKIRAYMQKIYAAVTGGPMGKSLSTEERAFFDKVFGKGEKPALMQKKGEPTPGAVSSTRLAKGSQPGPVSVQPEGKSRPAPRQPEKAPHIPGERSLPKTLEARGIEGGVDRDYDVKHLDESAQAAIAEIKAKGAEAVQQDILGRPKFDPQDMPRAIGLMRQWQHEADGLPPGPEKTTALAKVVQMASEMGKRATEAGQFNAMVRILERLSPDGVVYYAQKQLEKHNATRGPKQQVKLKPETATVLREAAKEIKASTELAEDAAPLAKAAGKIEKGETLSVDDLAALKAFRSRLGTYLGELPPERPKGILGGAGRPKPPKPAAPGKPAPTDNAEAILAARETAALERLKARGLKPTKALLQSTKTLAEEDVSDLADVFASRLAQRKASVSAIRQNFVESFGADIAPYLDEIAQKGARRLQETRRERVKLTELSKRVDAILDPLLKGQPQEVHQAEQLRAAFTAVKDLTGDAKREASWDLQEALNAMVPAGAGKKASAILAMTQLLNPKTAIRNIVGNEIFHRAERASKWVAANGIDWPRSKLTGTDRVLTFRTGGQGEYWKNLMRGSEAAIRGVNPEGLESKYDLSGSAFQDKRNPFFWAERALGVTLRATDYAAYKRAFGQTMGEMAELSADRKKMSGSQRETYIKNWIESAAPEVAEIAEAYGKYATFQDATALAKGAAGLKNFLNAGKDFGLGNFIINYPKTPANILMRAIEYSPVGIIRSLHLLSEPWRTGIPRDVRELEMSLGRVLVGGMGGGLAWYLAKNGALTGQADKDKDVRTFKREQTGDANYQVNVSAIGRWITSGLKKDQLNKRDGDTLISYDWAQPLAINAAMTATAVQALSDKKHPIEGALATAEAGLEGATKTLEEQPLLSGLEKVFNSDKSIPGRLMEVLEGVPASFSPTLLNQIRQIKDNTARDTQAPTAPARMVNKILYRLPFLSETLPAIYKTLGKSLPRENYQNGTNNLFNVFMNPAFVAKYHIDPDLAVVLNPYETEGRKNQFPKSLSKRKLQYEERSEKKVYEMSGEELSELQRRLAQETYRRFQSMKMESLAKQPPERQEKEMADGVNDSWNRVRKEFLREKGIKVK